MKMIGKRELIFIALILALPIAAWFGIFKPRRDDIPVAYDQIEKNNAIARTANESSKKAALTIKKEDAIIKTAEDKINELQPIVDSFNTVGFRNTLNDIRKTVDRKLEIRNISRGKSTTPDIGQAYGNQIIKCEITGRFRSINEFLQKVEKISPMVYVKSLTITPANQYNSEKSKVIKSKVTAMVVLQVYYRTTPLTPPNAN